MAQHARGMRRKSMIIDVLIHHTTLAIQRPSINIKQQDLPSKRLCESRRVLGDFVFDLILTDKYFSVDGVQERFVELRN